MKNVFNEFMQQEQGYLKTLLIILEVSAAFERTVQGDKINHTQRKAKEHIHTRNRNAT